MAEEKYYDENKCPICNSQKITYCGSEIQNPYLFYRCICDKCNTTFDMYYPPDFYLRGDFSDPNQIIINGLYRHTETPSEILDSTWVFATYTKQ